LLLFFRCFRLCILRLFSTGISSASVADFRRSEDGGPAGVGFVALAGWPGLEELVRSGVKGLFTRNTNFMPPDVARQ
jgi:hypothetical protein